MLLRNLHYNIRILLCAMFFSCSSNAVKDTPGGNTYYFSTSGNDTNDGSKDHPLKTISHLNTIPLKAGDTVYFKGGEIFNGTVIPDSSASGTKEKSIVFTSFGNGTAVINSGNAGAFTISHSQYITLENITCKGSGRKEGNTENGVAVLNSNNIVIHNLDISGYQKAGLLIYNCVDGDIQKVFAHDNGFAGISISGETSKNDCRDIYIGYCRAENNPGDPTNLTNHSGNGIIAGLCRNVNIDYCSATNNGWDMPRIGNGPVGIWCYEADSVVIQHCISYQNKTSKGGEDGGGYDLDGGVTNSVIQYCLSYGNQGSAFGIFQYAGASPWHDNTIRFCVSENDGNVSAAHANIYVWNSSHDSSQFKNLLFYNNTIYNDKGSAISYSAESDHAGFKFYNNIFVAAKELTRGKETGDVFLANDWWSLPGGFSLEGFTNLNSWAITGNKEMLNKKITGFNINPFFKKPGKADITDPLQLKTFFNYQIPKNSPLQNGGIDLKTLFGIDTGEKDFTDQVKPVNGIGACF